MHRSVVASAGAATLLVASLLVWFDARQEREYRRLLATGEAAVSRGQTFEAIEAFSGALALKPTSMIARLRRGDTYRQRAEYAAAVRDLTVAASLDSTSPRPLELLGDTHAAMGESQAAVGDYRRSLELDDSAPRVVYKLGLAQYQSGNLDAAVATLRRAIALNDRLAEAHYVLGLGLRDRPPAAQAERALLRALEINPALAAAREELARLYLRTGRPRQAIDQLEALSALEPARPERLVRVGLAYARLGRTDAAVLTLGQAAERHPDAAIIRTAIGRVWLEAAEHQDDPPALRKALEALAPIARRGNASSETLTLYARALLLDGDLQAAERALLRAAEQFPVDPSCFRYLAQVARRLGHAHTAQLASARSAILTGQ